MLLLWTYLPLLLFAALTNALQNDRLLRNRLGNGFGHAPHRRRSLSGAALTVELNIDHFGSGGGTFKNRYWVNDTYYDGGPVFVYDVGEANAENYYVPVLQEGEGVQSSVMALAKKHKGLAILWEHRYYGQSVPFLDKLASVDNFTVNEWQYLTFDQALEDFVVFAKGFTLPSGSRIRLKSEGALRPQNTPWVVVGASYPGVRAAVLRVRNPEVVFASWSSSGPIQAQINMASYYEAVERALPRNCSADWVTVIKYVDGVLMGNNTTEQIAVKKALYVASASGPGGNTSLVRPLSDANIMAIPSEDIVNVMVYPAFTFQSYGLQTILPFCDRVETLNSTSSPTPQGLSATQSVNVTFGAFAKAIAELDKSFLGNDEDASDALSWTWQYCTEFGYYQVADLNNPVNIEPTYFTIDEQQQWCNSLFNDQNPRPPNVTDLNKYGGWNMTPSNVFFSNGEYDPWRTLSVNSQESNSPQRNGSETIPTCNTSPQFPSFFGTTYPQQVHGADVFLRSTYPQSKQDAYAKGGALFSSALGQWLSCYNKTVSSSGTQKSSNVGLFLLVSVLSGSFLPFMLN